MGFLDLPPGTGERRRGNGQGKRECRAASGLGLDGQLSPVRLNDPL